LRILIGFTFSLAKTPTTYAQANTSVTMENKFSTRLKSVKCVSSMLNPLNFNALNAVSTCQRSL
jgi:hypothetical protein